MEHLPMLYVIITNQSASLEASFGVTAASVDKEILTLCCSQYEGLQ